MAQPVSCISLKSEATRRWLLDTNETVSTTTKNNKADEALKVVVCL